jgi:hypothetical protein
MIRERLNLGYYKNVKNVKKMLKILTKYYKNKNSDIVKPLGNLNLSNICKKF